MPVSNGDANHPSLPHIGIVAGVYIIKAPWQPTLLWQTSDAKEQRYERTGEGPERGKVQKQPHERTGSADFGACRLKLMGKGALRPENSSCNNVIPGSKQCWRECRYSWLQALRAGATWSTDGRRPIEEPCRVIWRMRPSEWCAIEVFVTVPPAAEKSPRLSVTRRSARPANAVAKTPASSSSAKGDETSLRSNRR